MALSMLDTSCEMAIDGTAERPLAYSQGEPAPALPFKTLVHAIIDAPPSRIIYESDFGRVDPKVETSHELRDRATVFRLWLGGHTVASSANTVAILQIAERATHLAAFWGCLMAGVKPLTVSNVDPTRAATDRALAVMKNAVNALTRDGTDTCVLVLTDSPTLESFLTEQFHGAVSTFFIPNNLVPLGAVPNVGEGGVVDPAPADTAFFQLSAGSTGLNKVIQITHQGVLHHVASSAMDCGYTKGKISMNWLPFDHVVPMLTTHCRDIILGIDQVQVPTTAVLERPLLWLDVLEAHRVNYSWAPNSCFALLAKAVESQQSEGRTWDLSQLEWMMNAGELVTAITCARFLAATQLDKSVMQPAFGMAECCTCMTYNRTFDFATSVHRVQLDTAAGQSVVKSVGSTVNETKAEGANNADNNGTTFVDLGPPSPGFEIKIVDTNDRTVTVKEGVVGLFCIRGLSVTPGYYNNAEANTESMLPGGWFDSGDLGYIYNGRLFLTGRLKETIIIRGVNLSAYEIEDRVSEVSGVRTTFVAATSTRNDSEGTEKLLLFFVPDDDDLDATAELLRVGRVRPADTDRLADIAAAVSKKIFQHFALAAVVVPLPQSRFYKTTSGKIQRTRFRGSFEAGVYTNTLHVMNLRPPGSVFVPVWSPMPLPVSTGNTSKGSSARTLIINVSTNDWTNDLSNDGSPVAALPVLLVQHAAGAAFVAPVATSTAGSASTGVRQLHADLLEGQAWSTFMSWAMTETFKAIVVVVDHTVATTQFLVSRIVDLGDRPGKGKVSVVTELGLMVNADDRTRDISQEALLCSSTLTSVLRALADEATVQWDYCHVDLQAISGAMDIVLQEASGLSRERCVAYRDDTRYILRLRPVDAQGAMTQRWCGSQGAEYGVELNDNGNDNDIGDRPGEGWIVTGAYGGIGRLVVKMLLESSPCVHVLGTGRSTTAPDDCPFASEARFTHVQCDVSSMANGVSALSAACLSLPSNVRVAGAVHLAGVYDQTLLASLTPQAFESVIAPKVQGALALHTLFAELPRSILVRKRPCMVYASSVVTVTGGQGTAAYGAANIFLERFAEYQRGHGVDAIALAWSMWSRTGMAKALAGLPLKLKSSPFQVLQSEQCIAWLPFAPVGTGGTGSTSAVMVVGMQGTHPRGASILYGAPEQVAVNVVPPRAFEFNDQAEVLSKVCHLFSHILGQPISTADADRHMSTLATVDSMSMIQLRRNLEVFAGVEVPLSVLLDNSTIAAVANAISRLVGGKRENSSVHAGASQRYTLHGRDTYTDPTPLFFSRASSVLPSQQSTPPVMHPSAKVGKNVVFMEGVVVHENCVIGDDCVLGSNVVLYANTVLGNAVVVDAHAVLGPDVSLGAHCRVGKGVAIENSRFSNSNTFEQRSSCSGVTAGEANTFMTNCVLHGTIVLGSHNSFHPHVVLGDSAEDGHLRLGRVGRITVGNYSEFLVSSTVACGISSKQYGTWVEDKCYVMAHAHIGHDCHLESNVNLAPGVKLAAFCFVGYHTFVGLGSNVHQYTTIGAHAMIAMGSPVAVDVLPCMLFQAGRCIQPNEGGLKQRGFTQEDVTCLEQFMTDDFPTVLATEDFAVERTQSKCSFILPFLQAFVDERKRQARVRPVAPTGSITQIEATPPPIIKVVLYGASSLAKLIRSWLPASTHQVIAVIDDNVQHDNVLFDGLPVIKWSDMHGFCGRHRERDVKVIVAVGYASMSARSRVFQKVADSDFQLTSCIHSTAIIDASARLGRGVVVGPNAVIDHDVDIGDNVMVYGKLAIKEHVNAFHLVGLCCGLHGFAVSEAVNKMLTLHYLISTHRLPTTGGAYVTHEGVIGKHTWLSARCTTGGHTVLGQCCMVGLGATIIEKLTIGNGVVIGAGAVVIRDCDAFTKNVGNPTHVIGTIDRYEIPVSGTH